jgi:hypothetical protein
MRSFRSLEDVYEAMDEHSVGFYDDARKPVALMLLGRSCDAARQLAIEVDALGERTDEAAQNYRRFAAALSSELAGR